MKKIDWSKVKIEEEGRIEIGNPHTMPKLDINSNYIVGMGDSPNTPLIITCNGNVSLACQNPNTKLHINN